MMDNFKRIFVVGSLPAHHYRTGAEISAPLWVKILYIDGRLSITGVHGPLRNGEAHGDCGQVTERLAELLKFPDLICVEGGTETVRRLLYYWEEWHLNSMRAHCDHQIAVHNWDVKERVQLWRWQLESPILCWQRKTKEAAEARLLSGETVAYSAQELELLRKPFTVWTHDEQSPGDGYKLDSTTEVSVTSLWPMEELGKGCNFTMEHCHPKGILAKPCPTCGHKWGSAWLHKDVPEEVLQFLTSMPHDPENYPWKN